MLKSNRNPTQLYKVIIEKPAYAGDEMHSTSETLTVNMTTLIKNNSTIKVKPLMQQVNADVSILIYK